MPEQEIVTPQVDAMEDLAWNPLRLQEFERQRRLGIGEGPIPASPAPLHPHTAVAPQLSTAQRRANQADQPREGDGKYAERPPDKWDQIRSAGANAKSSSSSSSSRASEKPGITGKHIAHKPQAKRRATTLTRTKKPAARAKRAPIMRGASVEAAMDFSPMGKVKWLVGRRTAPARRRWKRRWKRLKVGARRVKEFFGRFRRVRPKKKLPRLKRPQHG